MKVCSQCGEEVRRIYSVASCDEDDYFAECGCGMDADEIIGMLAAMAILIGLLVLAGRFA